jgi:hypothetical protein
MNSAKSPNQTNDDNDDRRQRLARAQEIVRAQVPRNISPAHELIAERR